MPAPIQSLVLVLTLGACAEMNIGAPGDAAAEPGTCAAGANQDWVGKRATS